MMKLPAISLGLWQIMNRPHGGSRGAQIIFEAKPIQFI